MNPPRTCFIVMPFGQSSPEHSEDYWTGHFERFLCPLINGTGKWSARRSAVLTGDIIRELVNDLVTAPAVVVDLTDANANVYWELGVRQSFRHGTITIAEAGTRLPFDIGMKATLFYHPKNHLRMEEFRQRFVAALDQCWAEPNRPDSHVLETISGRGSVYELLQRDEAIRRLEALQSEINHNDLQLKNIQKVVEERERAGGEQAFHTTLLRRECTELLMTHRYVDRGPDFYEVIEAAYVGVSSLNQQLGLWETSPIPTTKWLKDTVPKNLRRIERLGANVRAALEAMRQPR
jgi:hypothetical protein